MMKKQKTSCQGEVNDGDGEDDGDYESDGEDNGYGGGNSAHQVVSPIDQVLQS